MANVKVICWGGGGGGQRGGGGGGGGGGQLRALPLPYKRLQNFETL